MTSVYGMQANKMTLFFIKFVPEKRTHAPDSYKRPYQQHEQNIWNKGKKPNKIGWYLLLSNF